MFDRDITDYIKYSAKYYPVVTVTGPRQSGKTTLVKMIFSDKPYVSLEDIDIREFAQNDPRGFLSTYSQGAIIDEVQYCPNLFSYIQTKVDNDQIAGQFILTGSQNFLLLESISQSLAGRAAIVYLLPLSYNEISKKLPATDNPLNFIFKGFYPKLYTQDLLPSVWYRNYIRTYIERDIRQIKNISDISTFQTFLKICATRIGQLVNFSSIATECSVSYNTVKSWLSLLQTSFIIYLVKPHHKNYNKRLVKQEKLYFYDTGLACTLLGLESIEQLEKYYAKGSLFENMIVVELLKNRLNKGKEEGIYFWRDSHGHELDILIESDKLTPIEVKASKTIIQEFFKGINYWSSLANQEKGYLVYAGDTEQIRGNIEVLPWNKINKIIS